MMTRKSGRWHDTQGLGEIVGGIGGLLLLVFLLTGAFSLFRLWQTHQVLDRAASVALRTEEQQGCWTSSTNQAVASVIQQGGLTPSGVHVTTYTGSQVNYGQPVAVGLNYSLGTDFLFGGAGSMTEHAGQTGSSFYVPTQVGGSASCSGPNLGTTGSHSGSTTASLTLVSSATQTDTGQEVTLTASSTQSGTIDIVDTTTNHVMHTCSSATSCRTTVRQYTGNHSVSQSYSAVEGSATSNGVMVTWVPVATATATWGTYPANHSLSTSGVTWPNNGVDRVTWNLSVSSATSRYRGWSQAWDSPSLGGAGFSPTDTSGWLAVDGLSSGTHRVVLAAYFANGAVQLMQSPSITLVTPTVSLSASANTLNAGHAVTLSASDNFSLAGSGYDINIEDTTTGHIIAHCGSGSSCSTTVTHQSATTQHYQADIGPPSSTTTASGVIATSGTHTVTWQSSWSASAILLPATAPVTLTACVDGVCHHNAVTVNAGTPVTLSMHTTLSNVLYPVSLKQNASESYWTGMNASNGSTEVVTGPTDVVSGGSYANSGSGTGTAYFQLWPEGGSPYEGQGSNIVAVTWR